MRNTEQEVRLLAAVYKLFLSDVNTINDIEALREHIIKKINHFEKQLESIHK